MRLDVVVGSYLYLRTQVEADALDLAVVMSLPSEPERGAMLRRTRFVWAAAHAFDFPGDEPIPLAFAPSPCVHRLVGVDALQAAGLEWRVSFTSPSQEGLRAAVLAGLAVTALPQEDVRPGMDVIDGRYGLPPLTHADFRLLSRQTEQQAPAVRAFGQLLTEMAALALP